jgi:undecaprenyl-diphosphatase
VLGLVQGLTEFIPVSSSGHLIIVRSIFDLPLLGSLGYDAILQLATSLAVLVYFYKDFKNMFLSLVGKIDNEEKTKSRKLFYLLIVGTIPAVILGLILEKFMDSTFRSVYVVSFGLIVGALLMHFADKLGGQDLTQPTIKKSVAIGFFQSLALIPGMSRSGSTISGGLLVGLNRSEAVRFSFLLSVPILLGSGAKKLMDVVLVSGLAMVDLSLIIGCLVAFMSGLWAIHFLVSYLKDHSLKPFIIYRIILALIILFVY